jgi:transposase-like protein
MILPRFSGHPGLHETVLRRWMTLYGARATGAARRPSTQAPAPSPSDLAAENAQLRRENDRLRMERDILKKPRSSSESGRDPMSPRGALGITVSI